MPRKDSAGENAARRKARPKARPDAKAARPGRPAQMPAAEREQLVLDAMERVIAAKGLGGASMAAIAREAGMSKRTLYRLWDSRDAMFEALVRRLRASVVRPLRPEERDLPLAERLRRLLRPEARYAASEARAAVLRAIIAEAPRHPDLARAFVREGPRSARRIVQEELGRAVARGEIVAEDTEAAARLLCDMAYINPLDRLIDPDESAPSAVSADRRLELALRTFLGGAACRQGGAGAVRD